MPNASTGTISQRADDVRARVATDPFSLLIGGKLVPAQDGRRMPVSDPSTGKELTTVPLAGAADVAAAVEAAAAAQPAWHRLGLPGRKPYLQELGRIIAAATDELAMLDSINGGNPFAEMVKDVRRSVRQFSDWVAVAEMYGGKTVPIDPANLHFTEYIPYGVVARIVAFNHPAYFAIKALIPPLVMGNAVVLKAADQAPLPALRIGELFRDVLPPGVLNIVSGDGTTGDTLVRHPLVKRIGFTGSVPTAQRIQASAAEVGVKHVSLELGGKNAMIVFPDAPIEEVARAALRGMGLGVCQGQSCGSTSRVFAHRSIRAELVEAIAAELASVVVGPAYAESTTMGPLVSAPQRDKVTGYVTGAVREGARLVSGGSDPIPGLPPGYYVAPTLFDGVEHSMRVAREEIFGPVISVLEWTDHDAMIEQVNAVDYGLTASVWTDDLHQALHTARAADVGYVWVNEVSAHYWGMPFGGTKASGLGREETQDELASYAETKAINVITRPLPARTH